MTIQRLVSLGRVVIDIVTWLDELPERGADVVASGSSITPGGSAFNTLVAASRQGLPAVYGGVLGTGPFGDLARRTLDREGIEAPLDSVLDIDTGFALALIDTAGERTFVTAVGAEAQLTTERLKALRVESDDALHVSGYSLLQPAARGAIVSCLAGFDGMVLFDPGPLGHQIPADDLGLLLARADWWSGNRREARLATGLDDPSDAARAIAGRSGSGAIVRLGPDGCILVEAGRRPEHIRGYVTPGLDTNGAGDAHVGAFIAALAAGASSLSAAERAAAAAAISVARRGPATSPTREETDAFLAERHQRSKAG